MRRKLRDSIEGRVSVFPRLSRIASAHLREVRAERLPIGCFTGVWLEGLRWPEQKHAPNKGLKLRTRHDTVAQAPESIREGGFELGEPILRNLKLDGFTDVAAQVGELETNNGVR